MAWGLGLVCCDRWILTWASRKGADLFRQALWAPPAGVFDARSWNYWHLVFDITPVPPLPTRTFP